jgi:hypothetical protein
MIGDLWSLGGRLQRYDHEARWPVANVHGWSPDFWITISRVPALVAQGIEHRFPKPCVGCSNHPGGATKDQLRAYF